MSTTAFLLIGLAAGSALHHRATVRPSSSLWQLRGGQADIEAGTPPPERWDYIIIGAGAAGCVLADRLTADGKNRVLLLEAGADASRDLRIRVPAGLVKVFKSEHDWDFESEPVEGTGRGVYLCRGKCTGGSSSTNVMLYHRGTPADYDNWVSKGAVGWGPGEVLEYYRKAEDNAEHGASQYHGVGGPMPNTYVPYVNELSEAFLAACGQMGYRRNLDFNDWSAPQDGFGRYKVTQRNGERCSAWNAYIQGTDAKRRSNLVIATGAHVTQLQIDGSGDKLCAGGVEYRDAEGETVCAQLNSGGEVLLAAGAVQSPQLLMLSGLGPRSELSSVGIECRKDLPGVGQGLADHPAVLVSYASKKAVSVTDDIRWMGTGMTNPITLLKWLLFGKGALTSVACEFGGFFRTSKQHTQPDLQVRFVAARALSADGISTLEKMGAGTKMKPGFTTQIIACRPKSVGTVRLRTADPFAKPLIENVHLSDAEGADIATLREGIKLGRKICKESVFDPYRGEEVYPGPAVQTDSEIEEFIRGSVHSGNALIGTCRMGRDDDSHAVLDSELRVRGVGALRVIDASAMPAITGGQTCAPTIMIAEKGADLVLRQRAILEGGVSQQSGRSQAPPHEYAPQQEMPQVAPAAAA